MDAMNELDRIQTGGQDMCRNPPKGTALVHACKSCHSKLCGQPRPDDADYLVAEDSGELYLNLIDPNEPLFKVELFRRFLQWAEERHRSGLTVVIHCDQGRSRSRSLALVLGVRLGLLPRDSFLAAAVALGKTSGQPYRPSPGIRTFLADRWMELVAPDVERVRARAEPSSVAIEPARQSTPKESSAPQSQHNRDSSPSPWSAVKKRATVDTRGTSERETNASRPSGNQDQRRHESMPALPQVQPVVSPTAGATASLSSSSASSLDARTHHLDTIEDQGERTPEDRGEKKTSPSPWRASGTQVEREERAENHGYTLAEMDEIAEDPERWARLHGHIPERVTKEPIRFRPSNLQCRMFDRYRLCQLEQSPCRMVVPKIRRGGGSTGAQAIMYCHAHNYNARLGSIGTDDEVAMNMFKMVRFFDKFDTFPGWGRATKVLETGLMEWANGSTWDKYTAERPEAARSAGLQGYHASEVGRYPDGGAKDAKETLKSMLGAVPRRGFTVVIEESTAQGATGAFYDRFQSARWPTHEELGVPEGKEWWRRWADETPQNVASSEAERRLQFVRIFAAWFEDDENRPEMGVGEEEGRKIMATLDAKEIELIRRYRSIGPQGDRLGDCARVATLLEQLAWRRSVIATEFEGDVEGFQQENPSSPQEAFASSGRHTFNRAGVAWMIETAKVRTPEVGVLERQTDGGVTFRITTMADAWVAIWEGPREGMSYLQGVDTMGGKSQAKNPDEADYNSGPILRAAYVDSTDGQKRPHKLVANLIRANQDDPDILAMKTDLMCDWYGGCLCVHEDNNTGAAFRQEAKRLNMNLYRRVETDKHSFEQTEYVGWQTNQETRPQLFSTGKKYIRNNARAETRPDGVECWDEVIAREAADCIRHPDGKDAAPGSKHDDGLMGLLIALHCISGATYYAGKRRRRREPGDRAMWRPSGR